jgi:nitrite reductase/ring-hydroxylating ferredoxin subunit
MLRLCTLDQIPDPGALELSWGEGDWPLALFVVRRGPEVRGYVNRCPHAGHELNLRPNEFLTREGDLILCRSHGAMFRVEDGVCVAGPCPGTRLRALAVEIIDDAVLASEDELARIAAAAGY